MATSLIQIRIDNDLKQKATTLYEQLGIDLPTAIRIFIKRSVQTGGIPFPMTIQSIDQKAEKAVEAMRMISERAKAEGLSDMSLEEINEEIDSVRKHRP